MRMVAVLVLASLGCRGTTAGIANDMTSLSRGQECDRDHSACGSGTMSTEEALAIGATGFLVLFGSSYLHRALKSMK